MHPDSPHTSSDDDEFGANDFTYSSDLESQLRAIESRSLPSQLSQRRTQEIGDGVDSAEERGLGGEKVDKEVRETRNRLNHIAIELENDQDNDGEAEMEEDDSGSQALPNNGSAQDAAANQVESSVEDIFNLSGSQRSVYEDALVESVSLSVPNQIQPNVNAEAGPSNYKNNLHQARDQSRNPSPTNSTPTTDTFYDAPLILDVEDISDSMNGLSKSDEIGTEGETEKEKKRKRTLFKRFRKRGFFSVTDLVGPSWCEVQYD